MKKLLLILIFIASLLLNSCVPLSEGFYSEEEKKLYKQVELQEDENGKITLAYKETLYNYDEYGFFSVLENPHCINDGDIMLGWTGPPSGFFYTQEYYSYTQNSPLFIYTLRGWNVYFCETYDYILDTFVIEGTNAKIVFSDAIKEKIMLESVHGSKTKVVLRSETNPRVFSLLSLHLIDGTWDVSTSHLYGFEITDEFKQLLIENKII